MCHLYVFCLKNFHDVVQQLDGAREALSAGHHRETLAAEIRAAECEGGEAKYEEYAHDEEWYEDAAVPENLSALMESKAALCSTNPFNVGTTSASKKYNLWNSTE